MVAKGALWSPLCHRQQAHISDGTLQEGLASTAQTGADSKLSLSLKA